MSNHYGLLIDPERIDKYGYAAPEAAEAVAGGVADAVADAVDDLPPQLRSAVEGWFWQRLTYSELAERDGCSRGSAYNRVIEGMKRVAATLEESAGAVAPDVFTQPAVIDGITTNTPQVSGVRPTDATLEAAGLAAAVCAALGDVAAAMLKLTTESIDDPSGETAGFSDEHTEPGGEYWEYWPDCPDEHYLQDENQDEDSDEDSVDADAAVALTAEAERLGIEYWD